MDLIPKNMSLSKYRPTDPVNCEFRDEVTPSGMAPFSILDRSLQFFQCRVMYYTLRNSLRKRPSFDQTCSQAAKVKGFQKLLRNPTDTNGVK